MAIKYADYVENRETQNLLRTYGNRIKISELTEAVNRGLIGQDEVERAIKTKRLESLRSPVNFSHEKKVMIAQTMKNLQEQMEFLEATNPMAIGAYKRYAIDINNAVTANLIAPELVGVHTLEGRNGIVRYFNFNYGKDKGNVNAGRSFNTSLNMPQSDSNYTSNLVMDEPVNVAVANVAVTLKWSPIKLTTFSIKNAAGQIGLSDNFGQITGGITGTILPSGVLKLDNDGEYTVTYRYDNEAVRDDGPDAASFVNIPTADVEIGSIPVFADVFPMNATWSVMAEYDLMKETKMSLRDILQTQIIGEIQREVDDRIITSLFDSADASAPISWSETAGVGVSPDAHYNGLRIELAKASKKIRQATNKYSANYIVAGTQAAADIECITGFKGANTNQVPGSRLLGEVASMKIYETTCLPSEYDLFLGFKSSSALEAGAFYCPYMPVTSLGMLQSGDMRNREGFATSYAFTMVNSKLYQKGSIIPE